ncbi:MAG: hypothetical protein M0Z41_08860 [Peptococcaceae bacterium]|jgi:hypothetical protein|nr:hypothetical protein [Peptococcaceae bacterium]
MNKSVWDMTKEELEAMLATAAQREIARHHAAGRPTAHGDDKGVFLLHPDGTKEYVKLYNVPRVVKRVRVGHYEELDRV